MLLAAPLAAVWLFSAFLCFSLLPLCFHSLHFLCVVIMLSVGLFKQNRVRWDPVRSHYCHSKLCTLLMLWLIVCAMCPHWPRAPNSPYFHFSTKKSLIFTKTISKSFKLIPSACPNFPEKNDKQQLKS